MFTQPTLRAITKCTRAHRISIRTIATLSNNPSIYHFPDPSHPTRYVLTLLPTSPPNPNLSLGIASTIPPTPAQFTSNPSFTKILYAVLRQHATSDPAICDAAARYHAESSASIQLTRRQRKSSSGAIPSNAGTTSAYQGAGLGAGRGGWVHVGDSRRPPEWGRIPDPEDIFGSVEVDERGEFVGQDGNFQESGTYRLVTTDGVLGLSDYLMGKLKEKLSFMERTGEGVD